MQFNIREHAHLDHGYAVTSHSSQGQTAERGLIHVDTEKSELLVNNRFAYPIPKSRLFREEFPRIIMFMNASRAAASCSGLPFRSWSPPQTQKRLMLLRC